MIPFNRPPYTGTEDKHVLEAMRSAKLSGDGNFGSKCERWFVDQMNCQRAMLTPSCTHALELAALTIDIKPGDEVIMPSYTFVSTANAFVLRGASIVFVDIRPDTLNIDESLIESAITRRTKAIVPVHYAGVSCEMDTIMALAETYKLIVVEDAAQGIFSRYKNKLLGSIGHFGTYSFHETKNLTSGGEGGLLSINKKEFCDRAEIIREKGTNRQQFFRHIVDKYSWVDIGSSYLPSEIQSAYLWGQIESADAINRHRLFAWETYKKGLGDLEKKGFLRLPSIPNYCKHNGHIFHIRTNTAKEREKLLDYLNRNEILAVFHYVPLHTSKAGKRFSRFHGDDRHTTTESERLIRLPIYYGIDPDTIELIVDHVHKFYLQ